MLACKRHSDRSGEGSPFCPCAQIYLQMGDVAWYMNELTYCKLSFPHFRGTKCSVQFLSAILACLNIT